jgi:hypothetical protein
MGWLRNVLNILIRRLTNYKLADYRFHISILQIVKLLIYNAQVRKRKLIIVFLQKINFI